MQYFEIHKVMETQLIKALNHNKHEQHISIITLNGERLTAYTEWKPIIQI